MKRACVALAVALLLAGLAGAQVTLPLQTAQGKIEKVDKETLTLQPRGADGKVGKAIELRFTETSRVTTLTARETAGKVIAVQKQTEPRELTQGQLIAVTYTTVKEGKKEGNVLLTAVVQPAPAK
jgi:hypothetical protein